MYITLKLGGVPEHFNLPWRLAIEEGLFLKENIDLQWIDHTGGTGSMIKDLKEDKLDLAICLTEGIVADIAQGGKAKIIKTYVKSPLTWGIYVRREASYQHIQEIEGKKIGISRFGSGSHLMAYVKAQTLGWNTKKMQFTLLRNLEGIREGLQKLEAEAFMWEKVMTQPYVDSGELRMIDECVTPWSCFMLVANQKCLDNYANLLPKIAAIINGYVKEFKQRPRIIETLVNRYQIDLEDTTHWLHQTIWAEDNLVSEEMINNVQSMLYDLELIESKKNYQHYIYAL
ncbi:MAG: substrate-binding domain-containing protein [Thermonemataceae bacterium]|nr:substrate-binding domain-containing protein [Thermonemataceae bacterium]